MKFRAITLAMALLASALAQAEKTDVVVLSNGDRVTGEVIRLEVGVLEFNTDTMGRIFIEWRFIADLVSDKNHSIETTSGSRWLGQLAKPEDHDGLIINTVRGPIELDPSEVVSVWPVEATFWDKMELDTSVGFDYANSTDITNFNLAIDFRYLTDDRLTESLWRSDITRQGSGDDQARTEFKFDHSYFLGNLKFRTWTLGLDTNESLDLDLRVSAGASVGRYFIKTNNTWLTASGGLQAVNETYVGETGETNLEGVLTARHRFFRFADPERNLDTTLSLYPSLTDWGRVRSDFRTTFKLEFFTDLFWALELYATYDNEPPQEDSEKSDYGLTTSLGWSY
jgi:hypothetical protein